MARDRRAQWLVLGAVILMIAASVGEHWFAIPGLQGRGDAAYIELPSDPRDPAIRRGRTLDASERRQYTVLRVLEGVRVLANVGILAAGFVAAWSGGPSPDRRALGGTLLLAAGLLLFLPALALWRLHQRHVENGGAYLSTDLLWLGVAFLPTTALLIAGLMLRRAEPTMSEQVGDP